MDGVQFHDFVRSQGWTLLCRDPAITRKFLAGTNPHVRKVCGECPARGLCLRLGLDRKETLHVYGGIGPRQRRNMRVILKSIKSSRERDDRIEEWLNLSHADLNDQIREQYAKSN